MTQKRSARRLLPSFPPVENGPGAKLSRGVQTVPDCMLTLWSNPDEAPAERNINRFPQTNATAEVAVQTPSKNFEFLPPYGTEPQPADVWSILNDSTAQTNYADIAFITMPQLPSPPGYRQRFARLFGTFEVTPSTGSENEETFELVECLPTTSAGPSAPSAGQAKDETYLPEEAEHHGQESSNHPLRLLNDTSVSLDMPFLSSSDIAHILAPESLAMVDESYADFPMLLDNTIVADYPLDETNIPPLTSTPARVDVHQDIYTMNIEPLTSLTVEDYVKVKLMISYMLYDALLQHAKMMCDGCALDDLSQLHHTCLSIEDRCFYFYMNYETVTAELCNDNFLRTLSTMLFFFQHICSS
ncbi:uncharacterized protein LOC133152632 isoform X1 [Syngnathus typhle]|uniref:uncharacterized protein LOC133152632 isoform X1 n=1 Tax=Syngnathus typhle TaxID=161592 RepID=UPI002A69D60C|nr:uncharacterized protein LOC133152632 isoform X1 [Syngnathus typhle]XP_061132380.1 uncharacterized protein LOC133152632 isoform X1 [Syngnathus typhle]XP_061132381.1 uncharacterized protein LOC133152632 isoform X1 [Syngnathus typhle]XP_061132383.1 uncharacterized protein LOC133152632 isoform X1 [Syngnathus typhle]